MMVMVMLTLMPANKWGEIECGSIQKLPVARVNGSSAVLGIREMEPAMKE